jgi:hypothetical protein
VLHQQRVGFHDEVQRLQRIVRLRETVEMAEPRSSKAATVEMRRRTRRRTLSRQRELLSITIIRDQ